MVILLLVRLRKTIVSIWHEVLGMENIGIQDSFLKLVPFTTATQAVSNLKEGFGIEIPLHDLFMFHTVQQLAEQIDQLLDNKNQEMQNDSKENVSLQDYVQKEAEVSNDEELLELLKQLEELSEEEAQGIFESNLIEEGVKMRSDLLAKLSSLSPEKRAWLQKQMQKGE